MCSCCQPQHQGSHLAGTAQASNDSQPKDAITEAHTVEALLHLPLIMLTVRQAKTAALANDDSRCLAFCLTGLSHKSRRSSTIGLGESVVHGVQYVLTDDMLHLRLRS